MWDLNLRVIGAISSNIVVASGEARTGMLSLLGASGARLVQALVLAKVVERLHCSYKLVAADSLCAVLEESKVDAGAFQDALAQRSPEKKASKAHDMQDDAGVSAMMMDKLFPTEAMTDGVSWHALHQCLWKLVIANLKPSKLALCHFAGNPATKTSGHQGQQEACELALLRRLFRSLTATCSVEDYAMHVKQLLQVQI